MSAALAMRRAECERILAKRPNTCPILLLSASGKVTTVSLAPTATMADVEAAVREVGLFPQRRAVNLTVDGCTPSPATRVGDLYTACKSEDGFLHVSFSGEKRLGAAAAIPCLGYGGSPGQIDYDKVVGDATQGLKDQFIQSAQDVVTDEINSGLGNLPFSS